jgi:hypothetical protein
MWLLKHLVNGGIYMENKELTAKEIERIEEDKLTILDPKFNDVAYARTGLPFRYLLATSPINAIMTIMEVKGIIQRSELEEMIRIESMTAGELRARQQMQQAAQAHQAQAAEQEAQKENNPEPQQESQPAKEQ